MRPHAWIGLSDDVRLGVLTEQVTPELVDEALAGCGVWGWSGALSPRFMVYFTLALALFHPDSYDDVAENLVGALDGMDEAIPNKSNFTRARARLGPRPLEAVFRALAGPLAPDDQVGSFWRGMRLAAIDGFVLDAPDTAANRTFFGGPSDARGVPAGFPQVRVVTLSECGTHASIDAAVGGFNTGEPNLAIGMAGSAAGMLVIADRAFPGVPLWKAFTGAGAHLLIRARSVVARRPIEVLPDGTYLARMSLGGQRASHPGGVTVVYRVPGRRRGGDQAADRFDGLAGIPCPELAALYHQRWEAEAANRQIKTFQRGPAQVLRSGSPTLARQEVWAHLAVHHCLNQIMVRLARDRAARSRPDLLRKGPQSCPTQRHQAGQGCRRLVRRVHGEPGVQAPPQAGQRSPSAREAPRV